MSTIQLAPTSKRKVKKAQPSQPAPLQPRPGSPVSKIFVDPNGKPYKFYIKDLFPNWDEEAKKQLEGGIKENGGQVIDRVPREGFVVIDPSPEWGSNFGISYKILQKCHDPVRFPCRWVVHWKFVHDTVRLGRLEGRLLRECGFPAVGHRPDDHAQSDAPPLKRTRVWSQGKSDVFGGKDQSGEAGTFKCFAETLRIHIWKGITGDERDQLVQGIQLCHGYTVPRGEEADIILLPDPNFKYKYTPDDIAHLKPLIESRTEQRIQRVKFTSWVRVAIREGRWEGLWEAANVTLDQLVRPLEDFSALFSSKKRKRDVEEGEEFVSDESPTKVRRVEGRDGSKRKVDNPEPSLHTNTGRESAARPTAPRVSQLSPKLVNQVNQPPLPGKFSSRRQFDSAAAPKRQTQKTNTKFDTSDDDGSNPTTPSQIIPPIALDNNALGAPTNPTVRSVGPVAPPTNLKSTSRYNHAPHKTTAQGYETSDLRTEVERQRESLPKVTPEVLRSPCAMTPEAMMHSATAEEPDLDDARTHKILMRMFAESRSIEAADSSHSSHQSIDHDLVDLLEDDERILGNIKEMKEAEYPQLLELAVIIRGFEQRKRFVPESSEEAVLEEIAGDASPTL